MSLTERLDSEGASDDIEELVRLQRFDAKIKSAESSDNSGLLPPEMRLGPMTGFRAVLIEFTNKMNFPNTA